MSASRVAPPPGWVLPPAQRQSRAVPAMLAERRRASSPATINGRAIEVKKLKAQGLGLRAIGRELKMLPASVYKALSLSA